MRPETCPNCGAEVPPDATACPECGSDEKTGWSDEARVSGLGLPDDRFDYDDFVDREFGSKRAVPRGVRWFWWLTALGILGALLFLGLR